MATDAKKTDIETHHPNFATEITTYINESLPIDSKKAYIEFLKSVTGIIGKHKNELVIPNPRFDEEMNLLENDELNLVIPAWGGVAPQKVDKKKGIREKYLIVLQATSPSGVLGDPEYHRLKDEHLVIEEGYVLLIGSKSADWDKGNVTLTFAGPGDTCTLHPGNRHGIIAITNALILERANNTLKDDILSAWK